MDSGHVVLPRMCPSLPPIDCLLLWCEYLANLYFIRIPLLQWIHWKTKRSSPYGGWLLAICCYHIQVCVWLFGWRRILVHCWCWLDHWPHVRRVRPTCEWSDVSISKQYVSLQLRSSQAISCVDVELLSNVSETVSISGIRRWSDVGHNSILTWLIIWNHFTEYVSFIVYSSLNLFLYFIPVCSILLRMYYKYIYIWHKSIPAIATLCLLKRCS
jgi:hypothetical protein